MIKRFVACFIILVAMSSLGRSAFADNIGEHHTFFVNSTYDAQSRTSISATLKHVSTHAYFYIEDSYLNNLSLYDQQTLNQKLIGVGQDFDNTIYPKETAFWGSEPSPGVDNDSRVTILLERLNPGAGGYFDSANASPSAQTTNSNQREMITVNVLSLGNNYLKIFLAHEFQHLTSFNQKELLRDTSEEVWLNELRSQYAITLAGYNDNLQNSDLYQRAATFLQNPTDSLTEWPNTNIDYASVTLFGQYLVDRFGSKILFETLQNPLMGIASINKWLGDNHYAERFSDVFGDWMWTNYIGGQSQDSKFKYTNQNLQTIQVPATDTRQLTSFGQNTFSYSLKPWQPNWDRFILDSSVPAGKNVKISWHNSQFQIYYGDANMAVRALHAGDVIAVPSRGTSFILMPVNVSKTENFGSSEDSAPLTLAIEYTDQATSALISTLHDGSLIMHAGTPDIYVVTGQYKRYLTPEVLKFYGLDASKAIIVPEAIFQSYITSNYIRVVNEKKVYAVWPDGTKHWLNMSAKTFSESNRDWNSIFIVNDLESNFYHVGVDIKS